MLDIRKAMEVDLKEEYVALMQNLQEILKQLEGGIDSQNLANWTAPIFMEAFANDVPAMLHLMAGPRSLVGRLHLVVLTSMLAGILVYQRQQGQE